MMDHHQALRTAVGLAKRKVCPRCGRTLPPIRWPSTFRQAMLGGWTCRNCGCEMDYKGRERGKHASDAPPVTVHLDPTYEKVRIADEEINVPPGVCIRVRRTRTIEHTIQFEEKTTTSASGKAGTPVVSDLLNIEISITRAIEKRQGKTYANSEAIQYEVELQGEPERNTAYTLIWYERWSTGAAEIKQGHLTISMPIRFKEGLELEVQKGPPEAPIPSGDGSGPAPK